MASHPEVEKLKSRIEAHSDAATAEAVACGVPLSPDAGDAEKAAWVRHVVDELDRRFPEETIQAIRLGCHCDEAGRLGEMKEWLGRVYRESADIEDFVGRMNRLGAGWRMENGAIYTTFQSCECYMLREVDRLPSTAWCYCTVGYTKNLFEHVFDREVDSELMQSIKLGADRCVVKVTPKGEAPPQ